MLTAVAALRVRKDFKPAPARNVGGGFMSKDTNTTDFETAAMPYLNEIFGVATRLIGSRSEAEDLVQEVYMQAWKSFHCFEIGTNCRAWLFRILFNKHHHHRRKLLRWRRTKTDEVNLDQFPCDAPPVCEHLNDREILLAVERLPQCYREAVLLADVQDFSYKEIAAIMCVPVGTVMSRLSRGRKLLRSELADVATAYGIKKNRRTREM
ncbi:MAG: sigma-70 family RNA polymerase sigma factor [Pyrinomonadaceae bacterium MAG19_C2-C3]|nr:sigma-70 family RNA polymerase sigma factor [Pyrinomonadaceae bacterium MAG19_C2-C3]